MWQISKEILEILKDDNSTLEIENNNFEHNKIIWEYTNYNPSDYLVDENKTDFENLKVKNSKLEIYGKVKPKIIQNIRTTILVTI